MVNKVMLAPPMQRVKQSLEHIGFFVEEKYTYLTNGKRNAIGSISLAAFIDEQRRDISSIAIVADYFSSPPLINPFKDAYTYLAPELGLAVTPDTIQWWSAVDEEQTGRMSSFDTLEADFLRYRVLPDALRQTKGFQTSFIQHLPELSQQARAATKALVVRRFSDAISHVRDRDRLNKLSSVGLDLLTAIILDVKRYEIPHYRESHDAETPQAVFLRAQKYFPQSFRDLLSVPDDIVATFWQYLRDGMTYRSMTRDDLSDLLSSLYEGVLISPDRRRVQGSYYTPYALARRLLDHMPIEEIVPDERVVLDGSCGAGNVLRAASERLDRLLPANDTLKTRAAYLSQRIIGVDIDQFAMRIARRAQTVTYIPYDLNWDIRHDDFLESPFNTRPSIVITNPPFKGQRSRGGEEKATAFLRKYIDIVQDNGIIGIFLPSPLLQNPAESSFRSELLRHCCFLELWTLPQNSISRSGSGITVLIVKKRPLSGKMQQAFRVYTTRHKDDTNAFADARAVSQSYIQQMTSTTSTVSSLIPSELTDTWQRLSRNFLLLQEWGYKIDNGIQAASEQFADTFRAGWRRCLSTTQGFEPYSINWDKQSAQKYVDYSEDLKRKRRLEFFLTDQKIAIQAMRTPNNPWRIIAAIDEEQLIVKETFHYIRPITNAPPLEVLVAVLNSSIANAWYSEHDLQRNIIQKLLEAFPLPIFSEQQIVQIKHHVRSIMSLKHPSPLDDKTSKAIRDLVVELDNILAETYGLSIHERKLIDRLMSYGKRPGREWQGISFNSPKPIPLQPSSDIQRASGEVIAVNIADNKMVAEIPGISRIPLRFPIPPTIPGWCLCEGVSFSAQIPIEHVYIVMDISEIQYDKDIAEIERLDLFNVVPSRLAYLDDKQLWAYASTEFTD